MPCIAENELQIIHLQRGMVRNGLEEFERCKGIRLRIKRRDRRFAPACIFSIEEFCIALLNMRRIRQHDAGQIAG